MRNWPLLSKSRATAWQQSNSQTHWSQPVPKTKRPRNTNPRMPALAMTNTLPSQKHTSSPASSFQNLPFPSPTQHQPSRNRLTGASEGSAAQSHYSMHYESPAHNLPTLSPIPPAPYISSQPLLHRSTEGVCPSPIALSQTESQSLATHHVPYQTLIDTHALKSALTEHTDQAVRELRQHLETRDAAAPSQQLEQAVRMIVRDCVGDAVEQMSAAVAQHLQTATNEICSRMLSAMPKPGTPSSLPQPQQSPTDSHTDSTPEFVPAPKRQIPYPPPRKTIAARSKDKRPCRNKGKRTQTKQRSAVPAPKPEEISDEDELFVEEPQPNWLQNNPQAHQTKRVKYTDTRGPMRHTGATPRRLLSNASAEYARLMAQQSSSSESS